MEDKQIVELYWQRSERAIRETDAKYGALCRRVALDLLGVREDAEECVSDTYRTAWESMPTQRPEKLRAWLCRVVRNISVDRWRREHSQKRGGGLDVLLSELDDCVPAAGSVEETVEAAELGRLIENWLRALPDEDRRLFLRRYFGGETVSALAEAAGVKPGALSQRLYRLRLRLRAELEKEGVTL